MRLSVCLFYQGSWQLIFHPSRTVPTTPAALGMHLTMYGLIHRDRKATACGDGGFRLKPTRAYAGKRYCCYMTAGALFQQPSPDSIAECSGINVFAFDYHGFGQSAAAHPSELRTEPGY